MSVILVNYNGVNLLRECLASLQKYSSDVTCEIIVVDNASSDGSSEMVRREYPQVHLVENSENLGFSQGNNIGAGSATGKYLLFLNTDTIVFENSVKILADYLDEHAHVGAIGPQLLFPDRTFQYSAGTLPTIAAECFDKMKYALTGRWPTVFLPIFRVAYRRIREVEWLTGAALMVRAEVFAALGGFDKNIFMYFEDKDFCKRLIDSGSHIIYFPLTSIIHILAGSSHLNSHKQVNKLYRTSQIYYYRKHLGPMQNALMRTYLRLSGRLP